MVLRTDLLQNNPIGFQETGRARQPSYWPHLENQVFPKIDGAGGRCAIPTCDSSSVAATSNKAHQAGENWMEGLGDCSIIFDATVE